ncbi:pectate lyase [Sphingobacterium sp. DN00404]|uniref:Pectate lyase n=1 Tax=Sphingobacterium micropteri TaxID=2763501 RepID=A0ABR7YPX8_9SPHI|nr:pectate lyase [Sphingobacterium micropteri]
MPSKLLLGFALFFVGCFVGYAQDATKPLVWKEGKLVYQPDSLGNRIPDFSHAGYAGGNTAIPEVPVKMVVPIQEGDATARIQAAIDYVSQLPVDEKGLRGAVLLQSGEYRLSGSLKLHTSGVVLRGSGFTENGTLLIGEGTTRETLIRIAGKPDVVREKKQQVRDAYVPVNARTFHVDNAGDLRTGDRIMITRPSTDAWIKTLKAEEFGGGMSFLGWKPGYWNTTWDRTVVRIEGDLVEVDVPLTIALDERYGGAMVEKYTWNGRIEQVGIENILLESTFNTSNPKDEDHRWMAITVENATNVWVRRMQFRYFAGSAVYAKETSSKLTVEDCISRDPVSEIGGQRRYTFYTRGQQTLFQRLYSEKGYHDFAVGFVAAGPNAFVQCQAVEPYSFSGAIDSWASGVLFDIVDIDAQALRYGNRGQDGKGAGWTAANSVFWQSTAALIESVQPPTAQNWGFGLWAQFQGDAYWAESNSHINPRSLYYAQLQERVGESAKERTVLLPVTTEASSSPSIEVAMELTEIAREPAALLTDLIAGANDRESLNVSTAGVKILTNKDVPKEKAVVKTADMTIRNGWLVRGDEVLVGLKHDIQWWNGNIRPRGLEAAKPHITRYVPGETGTGLTDDLQEVVDSMLVNHVLSIDHNYGLWYDRRRDDHQRIRRMDGEVWPPFYELPFARSGQGLAYDGLSKYDLTKYNPFYWSRLKQFADLAEQNGLVLLHQNYFQHNILEAGAHYTDSPWRTANNINNVGFPEPVPYAGDKRIFMAEQFYDVTHPVRRELHRAYIRQCLENFKDNTGVIQLISAEYTGPLHFVEFWLDVVKEWKAETGYDPVIALSTTKDVQDAILADPIRSKEVQVIDIRYWYYRKDGTAYAPEGGKNLAPRQHARKMKGGGTSDEQIYQAVSEYRNKFPDKAVTYHSASYPEYAWTVFMAGGSMANVPRIAHPEFYKEASAMQAKVQQGVWTLQGNGAAIFYNPDKKPLQVDLTKWKGTYNVYHIHPKTGAILATEKIRTKQDVTIKNFKNAPEIIWITKK